MVLLCARHLGSLLPPAGKLAMATPACLGVVLLLKPWRPATLWQQDPLQSSNQPWQQDLSHDSLHHQLSSFPVAFVG